jgi:hypothetical protein
MSAMTSGISARDLFEAVHRQRRIETRPPRCQRCDRPILAEQLVPNRCYPYACASCLGDGREPRSPDLNMASTRRSTS